MPRRLLPVLAFVALLGGPALTTRAQQQVFRTDHVVVQYQGIDEAHARAMAAIIAAAREAAITRFGLDMPQTIRLDVAVAANQPVRLFNDGQDHFSLSVRAARDLARPATSGVFHLYGLCHEVGHLGMYRPIQDRGWLSTAAAEGWAHDIGSALVDEVHAKLGNSAWPDAYDYRADGTARLDKQLAGANPSDSVKGASLWRELAQIAGDKKTAELFKAWGAAKVDPADPGAALRQELTRLVPDPKAAAWWNRAEQVLLVPRPASGFKARTAAPGDLTGKTTELAHDDGQLAGKRSLAGGGHAVDFEVADVTHFLTGLRVHGGRYGMAQAPAMDLHVLVLDDKAAVIADVPLPYGSFARGEPAWVTLRLPKPVNVPAKFSVCLSFNPTATRGVFISHDAANSGKSRTGLPPDLSGQAPGDWLIRAVLDTPKSGDALKPME